MAILKEDIKLLASERLTDFSDGGGAMTGNEIISGELNNLFPDISRLDRVYGRVSMRKCFPAVMTDNQDMYYGSHAIVTEPPEDDNVFVTMFSRNDFDDTRVDAKDRIESYVSIAHTLTLRLLNNQLLGQRAIACFTGKDTLLPKIGDTIVIVNNTNGDTQYERITDIDEELQSFVHSSYGNYVVNIVTLGISAPLQYTFPGEEATPYSGLGDTSLHATVVADASKYYGVSKVTEAISQGDINLEVDSIYNQLVPTSQIETPFVDQLMGGNNVFMYAKGAADSLSFTGTRNQTTSVIHLPDGVLPGSLSLTIAGLLFRDLRGDLAPDTTDGGYTGTIDYASGQIVLEKAGSWSQSVTLTATPAVALSKAFITMEIEIELANRAYNYTPILVDPLPSPGSITVSFMAQGQWYDLFDDGQGVFVAREDGIGTGTVDYGSGSVIVTLGALPDVGSSIIISWGHGVDVSDISGDTVNLTAPIVFKFSTGQPDIKPGTFSVSWNGGAQSADDSGTPGVLAGDATGSIKYAHGYVYLFPTTIPASGTTYTYSFQKRDTALSPLQEKTFVPTIVGANVTGTLDTSNIIYPGSLNISLQTRWITAELSRGPHYRYGYNSWAIGDDGNGHLIERNGGVVMGTIDYATGAIEIVGVIRTRNHWVYHDDDWHKPYRHSHWLSGNLQDTITVSPVPYRYYDSVDPRFLQVDGSEDGSPIVAEIGVGSRNMIVPQSVVFSIAGLSFYDDGMGNLYYGKDSTTGVGTLSGTLNYATGEIELTNYPAMGNTLLSVDNLLTVDGGYAPRGYTYRAPGAPVRDGSLSLRATQPDGTTMQATAGNDGIIDAQGIVGTIDTETGIIRVKFGEQVTAAGNEGETWYNADLVEGGLIWRPWGVMPETALYNCVVYSFLPLDAELLGIEPIRLPIDGRVPIFKSGDVAVLHHTDTEPIGTAFTDLQVITLSRAFLSIVDLYTYEDVLVDESYYTLNLPAGTITITNHTAMNALTNGGTENIVANHRIEDMLLLSEAQINGMLTTVGPITHDYPSTGAQLSTALIFGDLAGRIVRIFHQKVWDNVWREGLSGDDTTAKYDTLNYPFILTNNGSADQRWCLKFTGTTTLQVIGETLGVIGDYNIANEIAPINPATSQPYFTITNSGWGSGWVNGNCIRFDTTSANFPVWIARTTMQGAVEEPTDNFVMQIRGDAN